MFCKDESFSQATNSSNKVFKNPRTSDVAVKNYLTEDPKPEGTSVRQESADHDHVVAIPEPNDPTPFEKILEVLHLFIQVFKQLKREKEARRDGDSLEATGRIKTLEFIENMGNQVNSKKRIGSVPDIEIRDDYQYKTKPRVVRLHSRTMCGMDYMEIGDMRLATSIVASEGYGYNDKFDSGVMVYTGEGGNVISKEKKLMIRN